MLSACARISKLSDNTCIRSKVSMLTPKAISIRSAISGDIAALPLARSGSDK